MWHVVVWCKVRNRVLFSYNVFYMYLCSLICWLINKYWYVYSIAYLLDSGYKEYHSYIPLRIELLYIRTNQTTYFFCFNMKNIDEGKCENKTVSLEEFEDTKINTSTLIFIFLWSYTIIYICTYFPTLRSSEYTVIRFLKVYRNGTLYNHYPEDMLCYTHISIY
jgi:hypothetical protein